MKHYRAAAFPKIISPLTPGNYAVQRCPTSRRRAPQRILIVKFGALGDILMTTPLLTALRRSYPNAHLTWLLDRQNLQALDANPFVDEIVLWDGSAWSLMRSTRPRNWLKNWFGLQWLLGLVRLKYHLYRRFDTLISFHPEQGLMLGAAAPKMSVGVFQSPRQEKKDYTSRYTKAYSSRHVNNRAIDFPVHQTDTYLLPLDALGLPPATDKQMVMGYTAENAQTIDRLLRERRIGPGFVVLAPKTTWASKCWPEERWSALGDALASKHQVVLIGSVMEKEAIERIAAAMHSPPVNFAGVLSFREAAAMLARASVCVSSDSGPMHLAAAVGTRIVSLFGSTPPARYAPLAGDVRVLLHPVPCAPCMEQVCLNPPESQMVCLRLLTVAEVRDAVLSGLAPRPNSGEQYGGEKASASAFLSDSGSPKLGRGGFSSP